MDAKENVVKEAVVEAAPKAVEAKAEHKHEAKAAAVQKDVHASAKHEGAQAEKAAPFYTKKRSQFADLKMFDKWAVADVIVSDPSLVKYIVLDPIMTPHTSGRTGRGRYGKARINIVERLVNKMMRSGQGKRKLSGKFIRGRGGCGKKIMSLGTVEKAFVIIERQTKKNPVQVLITAIENSAPREDVTRVKKGGVAYTLSVDVSPMKRLDESVKNIALASFGNSFNKSLSAEQALADEIIAAANNDPKSAAIKRKDEVERIAKSSR